LNQSSPQMDVPVVAQGQVVTFSIEMIKFFCEVINPKTTRRTVSKASVLFLSYQTTNCVGERPIPLALSPHFLRFKRSSNHGVYYKPWSLKDSLNKHCRGSFLLYDPKYKQFFHTVNRQLTDPIRSREIRLNNFILREN